MQTEREGSNSLGSFVRSRLWLRLTVAFALIILIGVLVTVLLARSGAATQFDHFMVQGRMVRPAVMQQAIADHYFHHQGWSHMQEMLPTLLSAASDGAMSGMMGNMMGMHENRLVVLDTQERVVGDSQGTGEPSPESPLKPPLQRWPLVVNGETIGTMVVQGALMGAAANSSLLVGSLTRTVLLAALAAGVAALALAALIVRQITQPLNDLSRAAQRISAGDLSVRVGAQGDDEIGAVARSFNQMADGLQQQEKLRRNLVADVAHELRTPLTGIQGAVEAMQDGVFPADAENLEAVHAEVMLLNRLVDDLRTLATAEAGQLTLLHRCFDIGELCRRQVNLSQYSAQARNISLTAHVEPLGPWVYADEQRIGQVLHNLLDNALRHCQGGRRVDVAVQAAGGSATGSVTDCIAGGIAGQNCTTYGVTVTVTDDGEGILPGELEHVFDRFYRADRSRMRSSGGSGLGLAIARQLVLAHGGDMWVQSPPAGASRGTAFGFGLPAATPARET
jgi:two-component system OmpR family sensor kinase/two-component system sensor histidine kinase BaeS